MVTLFPLYNTYVPPPDGALATRQPGRLYSSALSFRLGTLFLALTLMISGSF